MISKADSMEPSVPSVPTIPTEQKINTPTPTLSTNFTLVCKILVPAMMAIAYPFKHKSLAGTSDVQSYQRQSNKGPRVLLACHRSPQEAPHCQDPIDLDRTHKMSGMGQKQAFLTVPNYVCFRRVKRT